jgi:hypothetical protein
VDSMTSFRDISPVSTDRFRHSISLCPTSSSAPASQDPDGMQVDGIVPEYDRSQQQPNTEPVVLPDARSHPFLRWAVGRPNSPSWTAFGSIRHANIVQLEFQYYNHCAAATFQRIGCRTKIRHSRQFLTITPSRYLGNSWMMSHLSGERAFDRPGALDRHVPCEPHSTFRLTAMNPHGRLSECYTASYGKQSKFLHQGIVTRRTSWQPCCKFATFTVETRYGLLYDPRA